MKKPQKLYHATYKALLPKIRKSGLGNTKKTYWEDSKPGIVYLAADPDIAESYAEANENCPEEWLD
jgi:RNA:NAD 2'-phosphotransferase (TPT1/KptA family)